MGNEDGLNETLKETLGLKEDITPEEPSLNYTTNEGSNLNAPSSSSSRTNANLLNLNNNGRLTIDTIHGHYYKRRIARFRTSNSQYSLVAILSLEDMLEHHSQQLKEYLQSLQTRAINTLLKRHPIILKFFRKQEVDSGTPSTSQHQHEYKHKS